eukprot:2740305-Prymnesium_polylepis.1
MAMARLRSEGLGARRGRGCAARAWVRGEGVGARRGSVFGALLLWWQRVPPKQLQPAATNRTSPGAQGAEKAPHESGRVSLAARSR